MDEFRLVLHHGAILRLALAERRFGLFLLLDKRGHQEDRDGDRDHEELQLQQVLGGRLRHEWPVPADHAPDGPYSDG